MPIGRVEEFVFVAPQSLVGVTRVTSKRCSDATLENDWSCHEDFAFKANLIAVLREVVSALGAPSATEIGLANQNNTSICKLARSSPRNPSEARETAVAAFPKS